MKHQMKLRAPAVPLITVDPYFSVWCNRDELHDRDTVHWTGESNPLRGMLLIDDDAYSFMGDCDNAVGKLTQVSCNIGALVTEYVFANEIVELTVNFYTPLFTDDLYRLSRPVSYISATYKILDGKEYEVCLIMEAYDNLCLNKTGDDEVVSEGGETPSGYGYRRMGSKSQKMLTRCGDDLRIEWGYLYVAVKDADIYFRDDKETKYIDFIAGMTEGKATNVAIAYDDIYCLEYFGKPVKAYWKTKGISILEAIDEALNESEEIFAKCVKVSDELYEAAEKAGGEKYAELLSLAYRQVINGHKLAVTDEGENIFISKECFSNGCAATVDVTYPSSPFFILYNTELLKGMLRPIFKFAESDVWDFDFAPHDAGTYPLVNGQKYGSARKSREDYLKAQMPVEECGNMIIMMANICMKDGNTDFADKYIGTLSQWVKYLIEYGEDPANQLCTDDFAGHMAHNCNLSLKAIMGVAGYSKILSMQGKAEDAAVYMAKAKVMADSWVERAANDDCSFRLAFDRPGTFSMKYNIIWDKIWKTDLFSKYVLFSEFVNNCNHINYYGMPLDNRKEYTKSDWLVWTACLAPTKEDFEDFIEPLWDAYNVTLSRVPMTDWYDTNTAQKIGFQNRTVQGGLFIKLMLE